VEGLSQVEIRNYLESEKKTLAQTEVPSGPGLCQRHGSAGSFIGCGFKKRGYIFSGSVEPSAGPRISRLVRSGTDKPVIRGLIKISNSFLVLRYC
jgi:hypothetical protein